MTQQIEYFSDLKDEMSTRLGAARVSDLLSKSIFLISAGANDAFDFFSQNKSPDSTTIQQFYEAMISTYDSHVKVRALNFLQCRQIRMQIRICNSEKNHIWTFEPKVLLHLIMLEGTCQNSRHMGWSTDKTSRFFINRNCIFGVLQTLYNLGARKFAVINVPLIGCCPYLRSRKPSGECVEQLNQLAKSLNDGIRVLFSDLSLEMQSMKYSISSAYELVSSLIKTPHAAGKLQKLSRGILDTKPTYRTL